MKEKVIIYGGAFNPPTKAHQQISQAAADYAEEINAELWLMPSGERADKQIQVPLEKRLSYAHGLLASLCTKTTMRVYDYEIKSEFRTQTINTHKHLMDKYPQKEFIWLFGSDSVHTMPQWNGGDILLKELIILVVQRDGFEIELENNMHELKVDMMQISSTQVRNLMASGEPVDQYVPETVLALINND